MRPGAPTSAATARRTSSDLVISEPRRIRIEALQLCL
jgi:hypothetical protein